MGMNMKLELLTRPVEKEKDKDKDKDKKKVKEKEASSNIISVDLKGEREFVILTTTKAYSFAVDSSSMAASWVEHIQTTVDSAATAVAPIPLSVSNVRN